MSELSNEINLVTKNDDGDDDDDDDDDDEEEEEEEDTMKSNDYLNGLTITNYTQEMHKELSTPLLMITSPNDMVTYDKHDHDHDLDPQQQQSVTKDNQKNQLTVNKQRLYCTNPSMNYFNSNNNNNNRRFSDQGSRLSNQQSNLSTIYKRQSLFNINANHHHHHHLNYPNQSNQQHQYHNHDLYKTRLYPPTRLKNSSTSNVDLLAEAILKMQGTLNCKFNH
ncbi:unnamed protein product [Schistosoma mattheei]|uniref:Uncharacterized protein n=1 Tax=Schistosoma mattheei TaxID=31246 RepID=A0A183NZF2_9TREM|nr:unnamed protein product [Schistosoma mattheei]